MDYLHSELSEQIIKGFYHVYNTLGYGFLESVYEKSLAITLRKYGFNVETQKPVKVYFEGEEVGEYFADLYVDNRLIVELKSVEDLHPRYETQLVNYLQASDVEVGLVLNFGYKPEIKRRVLTREIENHIRKSRTNRIADQCVSVNQSNQCPITN